MMLTKERKRELTICFTVIISEKCVDLEYNFNIIILL